MSSSQPCVQKVKVRRGHPAVSSGCLALLLLWTSLHPSPSTGDGPRGCPHIMGSLQEQRLMCSYYAGGKHWPHRNVTCSMTDESAEALNLAWHSQPFGLSQARPLPLCWGSAQVAGPEGRRSGDGAACREGCFWTLWVQQEEAPCET